MSQSSGSNNTTIVAIVAIIVIAAAGFFAYQSGMFGGKQDAGVNIEFNAPN